MRIGARTLQDGAAESVGTAAGAGFSINVAWNPAARFPRFSIALFFWRPHPRSGTANGTSRAVVVVEGRQHTEPALGRGATMMAWPTTITSLHGTSSCCRAPPFYFGVTPCPLTCARTQSHAHARTCARTQTRIFARTHAGDYLGTWDLVPFFSWGAFFGCKTPRVRFRASQKHVTGYGYILKEHKALSVS